MSSPGSFYDAVPSRPASITPQEVENIAGNVSERLMQVKVLYNFDDFSRTNCLARCPQPLNIQTAYIDEVTQIGIIELKSCIQAIVAASPELVAKLGQDYTVYAYDYSEYETPLVGQGLLSWVLASASSTPMAPALHSNTMVTGRVCKNMLGLFSNGIKETLEVKLKLVPVPTCLQTEYLDRMEKHRQLVKDTEDGFDAEAWNALLNLDATSQMSTGQITTTFARATGDDVGSPSFHQILAQNLGTQASVRAPPQETSNFVAQPLLANAIEEATRAASLAPSNGSAAETRRFSLAAPSRPSSRGSTRATIEGPARQPRRASTISRAILEQDSCDEGPARKRARIEKAEWRGKPTFGVSADSLRVTASTAASIRGYKPLVSNSVTAASGSEGLPRPPTPRPHLAERRSRTTSQSMLRRQSSNMNTTAYISPYSDGLHSCASSEAASASPEEQQSGSASGTPDDIPSSPPVIRTASPVPSSPALPRLPTDFDSGFMSGPADERFEDDANNDLRPVDEEDLRMAASYRPRRNAAPSHRWQEVVPGPPELLPKTMLPRAGKDRWKKADSVQSTRLKDPGSDNLAKLEPASSCLLKQEKQSSACNLTVLRDIAPRPAFTGVEKPGNPNLTSYASQANEMMSAGMAPRPPQSGGLADHVSTAFAASRNTDTSRQQLQTVTSNDPKLPTNLAITDRPLGGNAQPNMLLTSTSMQPQISSQECTSPASFEGGDFSWTKHRKDTSAKRKKAIQERLASSVAEGTMPPYCNHCGAIETTTWRKAWSKIEAGSPDPSQTTEEETVLAVEALNRDEKGVITQYRIIRKSIASEEQGWNELNLCNPCGIWLNKWQSMRPAEKWDNPRKAPTQKRQRPAKKNKTTLASDAPSEYDRDDQQPRPDVSLDGSCEITDACTEEQSLNRGQTRSMSNNEERPRSSHGNRSRPPGRRVQWALQRAFQSSPPRLVGTKQSPIELDTGLTPEPTKRLLFPSPRKQGEVKLLDDSSRCTDGEAQARTVTGDGSHHAEVNDKENCPPPSESNGHDDDEFAHLFEGDSTPAPPIPPTTPTSKPLSTVKENLLRTPGSRGIRKAFTPKAFLSSAAKNLFLAAVTPTKSSTEKQRSPLQLQQMTPFTAQLNQLLSEANSSPLKTNFADIDFSDLDLFARDCTPRKTAAMFDFGDLGMDEAFAADAAFPSSPPGAFRLYEDPV